MMRIVILALGLLAAAPVAATTLLVGPGQPYAGLGAAVATAADGDTIRIAPGIYTGCASVRQDNLLIEGTGPGVVLTGKVCQGKALLITDGNNITIRNLTLLGAHVDEGNGAGIRAEGGDLTVDRVRFTDNQNGILSASNEHATIVVKNSEFIGNGACIGFCAHAIYAGHIARLVVEGTRIFGTKAGHGVKSRARRTEVLNCDIADGPNGTSSYLIDIPNGGSAIITGNRLEKGPHSGNLGTAISIGEEGVEYPSGEIVVKGNRFVNDTGQVPVFVRNLTQAPARLSGNVFAGSVLPLVGDGTVR